MLLVLLPDKMIQEGEISVPNRFTPVKSFTKISLCYLLVLEVTLWKMLRRGKERGSGTGRS